MPPHSIEAERGVLGSILLLPDECLAEAITKLKVAGSDAFYDLRHRTIYETMVEMSERKEAIDTITVQQRLKDIGQLDAIGGGAYLSSLPDSVPSAANLGFYLNVVLEKFQLRLAEQTMHEIRAAITLRPHLLQSTFRHAAASFEYLGRLNGSFDDDELARCAFNEIGPPAELPPVYTVNRTPTSTPGNLTAINAHAKGGKSAIVGAHMGAAMWKGSEFDTLGVESSNPHGFALLHFDTEQSPADHHHLVKRAMRRAGVQCKPDWLLSYCLTGKPHADCWRLVKHAIKEGRERFGGIHSVLIDGVADLVSNVNDPSECNGFVAELHGLAIEYDAPIIGIIHNNPGAEKTRGHLGRQLERKAETNLRLEKDGEITVVWSDKQRRAPILKNDGPRFRWDAAAGMHLLCETKASARLSEKEERYKHELDDVFAERSAMRLRRSEICRHDGNEKRGADSGAPN